MMIPDVSGWYPECNHSVEKIELVRRPDGNAHFLCLFNSRAKGACYKKGPSLSLQQLQELIHEVRRDQS